MRRLFAMLLFPILLACTGPSRYLGRVQNGNREIRDSVVLLLGTGYLHIRKFDGVDAPLVPYYTWYSDPGHHRVSLSYNDRDYFSTKNAEAEFTANAGETIMLCFLSTKGGSWGVLPLVAQGQDFEAKVLMAPDSWLDIPQNPTCKTWEVVYLGVPNLIDERIGKGIVSDFKTLEGQTMLQYAQSLGNREVVAKLKEHGVQ